MAIYENNSATQLVANKLANYDYDLDDLPGKADMEAMDSISTFSEYLYLHTVRCGYDGAATDNSALASFLFKKSGVTNTNISRQTLTNWLTKSPPAHNPSGRKNVYRLCFALEMDAQQTEEFFLKAYLERPFNYKDISESVYYFCLNTGRSYEDAQRIIETIESTPFQENPYADNNTELIGEQIKAFTTEEELLQYITENRSGFAVQNQSATEKISQLVESCMEIAPQEYAIRHAENEEITVDSIDKLLNVIYGYSVRSVKNGKPVYQTPITKSNFPALIKQNWPQREQFSQIFDSKKPVTYDVIRRALIMLTFYDFAARAAVEYHKKHGVPATEYFIFDEFTDEMNSVLSECGYVQLYWRNPFDWMIGYCAMSPDPIFTLQELIIEYYLSEFNSPKTPEE